MSAMAPKPCEKCEHEWCREERASDARLVALFKPAQPGCTCPYVLQDGLHYRQCPLFAGTKVAP